jgi:membrane protein DedA with SNARE-associated domain
MRNVPETSSRVSDRLAFGLLGAYLVFRAITQRIGIGAAPRLLESKPWVIPLLNNSSILLIQAGAGATGRPGQFALAVLTSVFLSTIVALIFYWAGSRFGHRLAELAQRPGSPWAGVWNPKQIARAERWMDRGGMVVVFLARVIEYFTVPVILVAGATGMHIRRFLIAHTLGAISFAALFLWIGGAAQSRWPGLKDWLKDVYGPWALRISLALLILLFVLLAIYFLSSRRSQPSSTAAPSQGGSDSSPSTD